MILRLMSKCSKSLQGREEESSGDDKRKGRFQEYACQGKKILKDALMDDKSQRHLKASGIILSSETKRKSRNIKQERWEMRKLDM